MTDSAGEKTAYTYDSRNRLTEAGGVTYTYDAENTRIATTKDGRTTEYVTNTGGSMSQLLTAYEAGGTETGYFYGAEGLAGQYNTGTKQYLGYHYDNIGSTTMVIDIVGKIVEQFAYGTYGELLTTVKNKIRFLYNGSYGVTTDENGLYYMRARYYNPDIKRFINQDIKVGDIGSSQSLNRYAYCEGNPVSLVDPFGLSPESTQDQGKTSKYEKLHNLLGTIGIFFDGADLINGFVYLAEKDYVNAAISFACGIPAVGIVVTAVAKTAKLAKYASKAAKIAKTCRDIGRIGNAAAGMKALYDTCQTAERECEATGEKIAYIAGTVITGYLVGKAANKGAETLKKFASKAIPKLKTALRENAGKLVSKVSGAFSSFGNKGGSKTRKILNVGVGDNPIPCATNIDINPSVSGVLFGDANDLSEFTSGQFDHVIALNPYKYNLLESDVPCVLKDGGIMSVTGNYSNKYFKKIYNASPETLKQAGFEMVSKGNAGSAFIKYGGKVTGGVRQTKGTPLQMILRKVGGQ